MIPHEVVANSAPATSLPDHLQRMANQHSDLAVRIMVGQGHGPLMWRDPMGDHSYRELECLACGADASLMCVAIPDSGDSLTAIFPAGQCPRTNPIPGWPTAPAADRVPNDAPDGEGDGE